MKAKKIVKFGVLPILAVMTVILLSVFGINAVAEADGGAESETVPPLNIAYCNVSFENEVHLMYAIGSADANVRLLVWKEAQSEYTYGTQDAVLSPLPSQMTIDGGKYTVFKYTGLLARQMADDVYVRAYIPTEEGEPEYGELHKYSILQYAYNKLGKTGTATTNTKLINMLNAMLEYGAAAQIYKNYKTDRLATDNFVQISLTNGTLADASSKGLFKVGSTVTISAPETDADGAEFVEWVDEDGNSVSESATAEIVVGENNVTYTAEYGAPYSTGLAFTLSSDGTYYSVYGIGTETASEVINIPPTHNGLPVKEIGYRTFKDNTILKKIIIPNTIEKLYEGVLSGCSNIESITLPFVGEKKDESGKTHFGHIFGHNSQNSDLPSTLKTVVITGGTTINDYAFYKCDRLLNIILPESLTSIGSHSFSDCTKLANITIPSSVTSINQSAFYNCSSLTNITIPDAVTQIEDDTFYNCSSLTNVTIGISVNSISLRAFSGCSSLENITVKANNKKYHSKDNCVIETESKTLVLGIKNSVIPDDGSVTSIGYSAFEGCSGLTSITIPDGVTTIKT